MRIGGLVCAASIVVAVLVRYFLGNTTWDSDNWIGRVGTIGGLACAYFLAFRVLREETEKEG